ASGPIRTDHVFYSAAAQLSARRRTITPLDIAGPGLLHAASIDPDSAERLLDIAEARGFPRLGAGGLADNSGLAGSALLRVDYLPPVAPGGSIAQSSDYSLLVGGSGGRNT